MAAELAFGDWPSPLDVGTVAAARVSRSGLASFHRDLYWLESRPEEGGRSVVLRTRIGGRPEVYFPDGASARSRVHEYGGGAFCLCHPPEAEHHRSPEPILVFVDGSSQRLCRWRPGDEEPVALTDAPPGSERWHHGDLKAWGRHVLAVREELSPDGVTRRLVAVDVWRSGPAVVLYEGPDFLAGPGANGRLALVAWDHPAMSWDTSRLVVGRLDLGPDRPPRLLDPEVVVGGPGVAVGQPLWCRDGSLAFVSDAQGWWQPWRWTEAAGARPLTDEAAEFHGPDWALGQQSLVELPSGELACRWRRDGVDHVGVLTEDGALVPFDQPCVTVTALCAHRGGVAWTGATPWATGGLWLGRRLEGSRLGRPGVVAHWADEVLAPGPPLLPILSVSVAEPFSAEGPAGAVHGLFYPPCLDGHRGPPGELPPLVVHCHGGPTGSADPGFDPLVQLLTTRGYAVAAVNYSGSTGYGRAYRVRLDGRLGELDADDCLAAARHLAAAGVVDGSRMAVRGSSSGGFTALSCLARGDAFAAAVSWYGVTDLLSLVATSHDFEAHYFDTLVGPLPEAEELYRARSPRHLVGAMHGAVLLLQGADDPVVPPSQAEAMADELRAAGRRCEYMLFADESHGFRRKETLVAALSAELAFYSEVLLGGR